MLINEIKIMHLKTMHHLSTAFKKLMVYKLIMQKILWNYYRDEPSDPLSSVLNLLSTKQIL